MEPLKLAGRMAAQNGFKVAARYKDEAISGTDDRRPGFDVGDPEVGRAGTPAILRAGSSSTNRMMAAAARDRVSVERP